MKSEDRNPNSDLPRIFAATNALDTNWIRLRPSALGFLSDFGPRISDL